MSKSVEVKKIVIRIGDKQAELTPEDAKALMEVLESMFAKKEKEKEYIPYPIYPYPYVPYVPQWDKWEIWSTRDTSGSSWRDVTITSFNSKSSMSELMG